MAWTTPTTVAAGGDLTATLWNTDVRDNLNAIGDAWATYAPSWTASTTNPAIGNGIINGRYISAGKLIIFDIQILTGSTTTYGTGSYSLTLPAAPRSSAAKHSFSGTLYDSSLGAAVTSVWPIVGIPMSGSTVDLAAFPITAGNSYRVVNATNVFTLASGDRIALSGVYEAA